MASSLKPPLHNTAAPRDSEPADGWETLKKWQDERLARRLRGEYESAVLHLSEVVQNNLSAPVRIASVRVEGAANTRQSFLGSLIAPAIAVNTELTLESALHTTRKIGHVLQETDIFSSVHAKIEQSRDVLANPADVDLVFKTRERGRFFLKSSTELGNDEGSASVTGRVRNVFGGAETFEANVALGTKTRRSYRVALTAPLTHTLKTTGELLVYGTEKDNTGYASSSEELRGLKAVVRNGTLSRGVHEFAYEGVLRHIAGLTPTASISMREEAGQSTKSSVSYTWTRDTRDDKITATRGAYTKIFQEFAGLGGDASFCKAEAEGQLSRAIAPGVTLSVAARTGLLWSLARPSFFSDRFQLGGPVSIRAFRTNSMGPRDGSDSLGGDMYWAAGLSVISNIPSKGHWPVKTHAFVNAGRLDVLDKSRPVAESVVACLSQPAVSAGLGLIYRFDPVRIEVNFSVPLAASRSDGTRRGIQVGMGLEFL